MSGLSCGRWSRLLLAVGATALGSASGHAVEAPAAGGYRVEVSLEMPNVRGTYPWRIVERCLAPGGATDRAFLAIVSSPVIADCPVARHAREGDRIEIEVVCEPANTGRASADFTLAEQSYSGRIDVTMGGKNMTLTEFQRGTRIGECPQ